jgi:hypothetical protein
VKALDQYLERYAEAESHGLHCPVPSVQHVLVIPAFKETLSELEQVWANLPNIIIVLVVNSNDPKEPITGQLLKDIADKWQGLPSKGLHAWYKKDGQTILVVDRYNNPIPIKQGVGTARKIGADIATRLINNGDVTSPWIMTTDADARLPQDYLRALNHLAGNPAFLVYPFRHEFDQDVAAALYEFSLLWYAHGLKFAASSYAFPTVGSTIACRAEAYAAVRGFPQRSAGEDFYLLNKLRKVGDYQIVNSNPIILSSRHSDRVPFGTGPGIKAVQARQDPMADHLFYHPGCFQSLKCFLVDLQESQSKKILESHFKDPVHWQFVEQQGLDKLIQDKQKQKPNVFQKFLFDWFDGFKTLKFVHHVREHRHGSVSLPELVQTELLPQPFLTTANPSQNIQAATNMLWKKL